MTNMCEDKYAVSPTGKTVAELDKKGVRAFLFDEAENTFAKAKEVWQTCPEGVVIVKRQTGGRGKGQRKFVSPEGGLYFTMFFKNAAIKPSGALKTVINAGLAVCSVLKDLGFDAKIKWPNDVLIGGKKVCGILTEVFSQGETCDFMCGVGLNVNSVSFGEFQGVAASLKTVGGKTLDADAVAVKVISEVRRRLFDGGDVRDEFFVKSGMKGKTVRVNDGEREYLCEVADLSPDGFLIGLKDGVMTKIVCGDIKEVRYG